MNGLQFSKQSITKVLATDLPLRSTHRLITLPMDRKCQYFTTSQMSHYWKQDPLSYLTYKATCSLMTYQWPPQVWGAEDLLDLRQSDMGWDFDFSIVDIEEFFSVYPTTGPPAF